MRTTAAGLALALALALVGAAPATGDEPAEPAPTPRRSVVIEHRSAGGAPVWGPRFAPVTADFFINIRSLYTAKPAYEALVKLQRNHPHRLRVVVRLIDIPATGAYVAEAALEAHRQGRFFETLEVLFDNRQLPKRDELDQLCRPAGIDCDEVERAIDQRIHVDTLEDNRRVMERMGARHTAGTVFFNGVESPVAITTRPGYNPEALEDRYDRAYAEAIELMRHGATLATVYQHALRKSYSDEPPAPVPWDAIDGVARQPRGVSFRPSRLVGERASSMARHEKPAPRARVVINFFCSFQSVNCGSTWRAIQHVMKVYPDEVHLQFNHFYDNDDANQPDAERAHEAALCAEDQGAFWEFYDYHFGSVAGRTPHHLDQDIVTRTAQSLGIDTDKFLACYNAGVHNGDVRALVAKAKAAGIRRTPTVIINGRLYEGRFHPRVLLRLVADELRPGLLEHYFPGSEPGSAKVR